MLMPITIFGTVYPKNKKDPPFQATICGYFAVEDSGIGKPPSQPGKPGHPLPPVEELPPIEEPPPEHPLEQLVTLVAKEPPAEGGWGWFPEYGWVYSPGEGSAQPKGRR